VTPEQIVARLHSGVEGVLVGRGVLRNPWILAQASDLMAGRAPRVISLQERGRFLLEYIELLHDERVHEPEGFRHVAPGCEQPDTRSAPTRRSHDRWVVNKIRALGAYYTKGIENGAELRAGLNSASSLEALRALIDRFFELA
jgi:tRNA-dihydrouridine synthase